MFVGLTAICLLAASVRAQDQASMSGKVSFEKHDCLSCHVVDGKGGAFGPELSWIGVLRSQASLRRSLTDPDAEIHRVFLTCVVETRDSQHFEGLVLHEDDDSLSLIAKDGRHTFEKRELKTFRREQRSVMPSYARLAASELDQLVAYLQTLRTLWPAEHVERTRDIAAPSENVEFFDRPERAVEEHTDELLTALAVPEGARVADVGAGTGFFTWRLAERVGPSGRVTAVDIQQQMLDLASQQVKRRGLSNVDYVLASEMDPHLPAASYDLVFIGFAYHEFSAPEEMMRAIRRALKPDGRVFVLEYAKENPTAPAAPQHKMAFRELRSEIEPVGFRLIRIFDFLPFQHGLVFVADK
jgi:putative heme-binding domain-containing protein